jgi:hypothetical protein
MILGCDVVVASCKQALTLRGILIYKSQQDAHVTEFILSANCSTCFGRHQHISSGAKNPEDG